MFLLWLVKCDFDETWLNDMRARGNGDTERILNVYINCADRLKGHTKHNRDISVRSYGFEPQLMQIPQLYLSESHQHLPETLTVSWRCSINCE